MKTYFSTALKNFFRAQLLQTRDALGLTQAQMAVKLLMAERSYAALESGESGCGALTLALFLAFCCNDPLSFIANLGIAFEEVFDRAVQRSDPFSSLPAAAFRSSMAVVEILRLECGDTYPICPRCSLSLDREFMRFCDRCGQRLSWKGLKNARIIHPHTYS